MLRILWPSASAGCAGDVDVSSLQAEVDLRAAAAALDKKKGVGSMNQCPYRIKDALGIGWWNCQLDESHVGHSEHQPPRAARQVEGIWHKPGEKSAAEREPYIPCVPSCWASTRPPKVLKEATSSTLTPNSNHEVRSTK
jgi:hypothetical protein